MKHIIIAMLMAVLSITNTYAQKLNADKVPVAVMNAFKAKFPTAEKVKWSMENAKEYEAEFKVGKVEQSANFSENGTWLETEAEISKSQLPQAVIDAINKKYPNCKIEEVEQASSPENSLFYGVTIKFNGKKFDIDLKATGEIIMDVEIKGDEKD
jgi:hypothetical protein